MRLEKCVFWHRRDLRLNDNIGLYYAAKNTKALIGVFVIDPKIFKGNNTSPAQKWFILESLKELKYNWEKAGSDLLIIEGDPIKELPLLCNCIDAKSLFWNKGVDNYSISTDDSLIKELEKINIQSIRYWDHVIINPGTIKTNSNTFYKVYTPFLNSWSKEFKKIFPDSIGTLPKPERLEKVIRNNLDNQKSKTWKKLPLIKNLNDSINLRTDFDGYSKCPCIPGEDNALRQIERFFSPSFHNNEHKTDDKNTSIYAYNDFRDIPSRKGTSFLSASLALGTISPRLLLRNSMHSKLLAQNEKHDKALRSIISWEKEIIWREFYHHSLFVYPELIKGPFKEKWRKFPWVNNPEDFNAWDNGLTGVPIVDAAMRQLKNTGWMHNRCRMIVASFLVKDLICDWRLGEYLFMRKLVDGDIASNNGGWQWSASSGMDSKPLRIFNPYTQSRKFDPKALYIKQWLPELSHVNYNDLLNGQITSMERRGYPPPIVNHNFQQAKFKELYAKLKSIN